MSKLYNIETAELEDRFIVTFEKDGMIYPILEASKGQIFYYTKNLNKFGLVQSEYNGDK